MKEEALELAKYLDRLNGYMDMPRDILDITQPASAMIRRLVEELDKQCKPINHYEPTAWINHIKQTGGDFYELNVSGRGEPLYRHPPQTKPLSDEELNKAFDYYCETDKGVLRFNYELRDEWKKEQLSRWKEAFKKASEK